MRMRDSEPPGEMRVDHLMDIAYVGLPWTWSLVMPWIRVLNDEKWSSGSTSVSYSNISAPPLKADDADLADAADARAGGLDIDHHEIGGHLRGARLRNVMDQRGSSPAAMLCSHS